MLVLPYIFIFCVGCIIGSFLNVVIIRYNTGHSLGGRSGCMSCGKTLKWYELFPVLSFFLQRRRCTRCFSKLSWQYPLVELLTGVLFVLVTLKFSPSFVEVLYYWLIVSLLIVITVYDLRHQIIPDGLVGAFIVLALVRVTGSGQVLAAALLFAFFALLWAVSGGRWMGFGDAKLAIGIGLLLGLRAGITAVMLAFWVGAVVGLLLILGSRFKRLYSGGKYLTIKSEIPFAPFLVLGILLTLLTSINVLPF